MELQRSSSFSTDLISEILLRLPEKSVVRFRCVSKLWLSITTDSYFINLFETRNPRRSLLILFKEEDDWIVSSIPQHSSSLDQNSRKSYSRPTHTYRMKFPEDYSFFTDSVQGLICLRTPTEVSVWNPSTSKLLTLPQPFESLTYIQMYLGYDPVEAKHKVIAIDCRTTCTVCMVITLGSGKEETWRIVKTNQKHTPCLYYNAYGQCIKGVIYYLASTYQMDQYVSVIMRFDVRSEKLDSIQLPLDTHVHRLISYEGRLACVYRKDYTTGNGFTLLILEENKWSSKDFLAPFYWYYDQSLHISFELKGFTRAGEFIYAPDSLYDYPQSLNVFFFDPVRNSFRRVGFQGIVEDKRRLKYIKVFPDHIESQMSL